MKLTIEFRLEEGYYTDDHKRVDIVDSITKDRIAKEVKIEYAEAIIKAVNEHVEK